MTNIKILFFIVVVFLSGSLYSQVLDESSNNDTIDFTEWKKFKPGIRKFRDKSYYDFKLKEIEHRKFETLSDTLLGNWQCNDEKDYFELLFINDTIYSYSFAAGRTPDVPYEIEDRYVITKKYDGNKSYNRIKVIDFNTINLFGKDTVFFDDGKFIISDMDIIIQRIPDSEFTLSKINCWKRINTKRGYRVSKDQRKYFRALRKRVSKSLSVTTQ